jgi:hypothetical protein
VTELAEKGITRVASVDFVGRDMWTLVHYGPETLVKWDWKILAEKPLLRDFSLIMKLILSAKHRWAMAGGEESLQLELARDHAAGPAERRAGPGAPRRPRARRWRRRWWGCWPRRLWCGWSRGGSNFYGGIERGACERWRAQADVPGDRRGLPAAGTTGPAHIHEGICSGTNVMPYGRLPGTLHIEADVNKHRSVDYDGIADSSSREGRDRCTAVMRYAA